MRIVLIRAQIPLSLDCDFSSIIQNFSKLFPIEIKQKIFNFAKIDMIVVKDTGQKENKCTSTGEEGDETDIYCPECGGALLYSQAGFYCKVCGFSQEAVIESL